MLRSVTQEAFKGGGALAGRVLLAMWVMVSKQWCSFSSSEDGLDGFPSPRSFKGLCELRSVEQQVFRGGGALAGSVMLAVWLMAFKQWRGYCFSVGEGGLDSLSSPRSLKGLSGPRSVAFEGGGPPAGSVPPRG